MGCGCSKTTSPNAIPAQSLNSPFMEVNDSMQKDFHDDENFVEVVYQGPSYEHLIPTTSGILTKYGKHNYGSGRNGVTLFVHKDDFKKSPNLFRQLTQEEKDMRNQTQEQQAQALQQMADGTYVNPHKEMMRRLAREQQTQEVMQEPESSESTNPALEDNNIQSTGGVNQPNSEEMSEDGVKTIDTSANVTREDAPPLDPNKTIQDLEEEGAKKMNEELANEKKVNDSLVADKVIKESHVVSATVVDESGNVVGEAVDGDNKNTARRNTKSKK